MPVNIQELVSKLENVKKSGSGYTSRCPNHPDKRNSLSVTEKDGALLIHCHAGCETKDVVESLGYNLKDLFAEKSKPKTTQKRKIVAKYDYVDIYGKLVYQSVRFSPKGFSQRRPDPDHKGKWIYNLKGVDPLPYNLPEVIEAVKKGKTIWLVEGEADVETLRKLSLVGCSNSGGAGKWKKSFSQYFSSARVALVADNDNVGRAHMNSVGEFLSKVTSAIF